MSSVYHRHSSYHSRNKESYPPQLLPMSAQATIQCAPDSSSCRTTDRSIWVSYLSLLSVLPDYIPCSFPGPTTQNHVELIHIFLLCIR
jgi:hypothetical protein